ncbi:ATP synthase subunit a [Marinithermofilum abyssi]|uniref:ATP synthase subunit a n=1 Tax=Marinithermofilum abyssi TaxID=1571185 RepID=A0A8J2VH31_9BACL|nr:F0F1 ATP synthase subunit A [Marinithermofilum abyssi]GGE05279.1 ATP synthase subunit a [Marinithermofilum abyssi]
MEATPKVEFLGLTFDVTVMIGTLFTAVAVFLLTVLASRGLQMRPGKLQNLVEMIIEFARGITRMTLDAKNAERYLGFALTLFLFILIANQLGIIMMVSAEVHHPIPALGLTEDVLEKVHGHVGLFKSPTADINVTVAMALAIALYAHFLGIKKSPKDYLAHYFKPFKWMVFLHLIDEVAKPTTHAMRLWANIFAGEVMILILLKFGTPLVSGAPLLIWMAFSLFVGAIQAYIFTVLATVYISQKISDEH